MKYQALIAWKYKIIILKCRLPEMKVGMAKTKTAPISCVSRMAQKNTEDPHYNDSICSPRLCHLKEFGAIKNPHGAIR